MAKQKKTNKKKVQQKVVPEARIHIKSSFNNTLLTASDEKGNVFAWSSTGKAGFKGTKQSTPYAATLAAKILVDKLAEAQTREISIFVAGVSAGRDAAIRAFGTAGVKIKEIKDITPIPHNGCRVKKPRRV